MWMTYLFIAIGVCLIAFLLFVLSPNYHGRSWQMLVLERTTEPGRSAVELVTESGEVIRVQIREVKGDRVKIAFEAPGTVKIRREELKDVSHVASAARR